MQIFIMRHGEAQSRFSQDASRELTSQGTAESVATGLWLHQSAAEMDLAIVSPYIRARQTLKAIQRKLPVNEVIHTEDVTPYGNADEFYDYLLALRETRPELKRVLIVSHMPFVSALVDALCGQQHSLLFATAGVAELHVLPDEVRASLIRQYIP
ncbi:phosphohistidine phosphatase SixA [Lacimicrobium alkaliphilum]|uniref:Phosphohistidine phosphatase SixA n=1 Tax=Lacimicrobium alkaliphilum TaxID=1526571 RepID=A0ABQ1RR61_9ALTE|nr:phosphohistidine phosphatase SixA [Lacimicrobium alkaliphilum]GGD75989.1 phosphohistidine phosphatase SixA [Lacimicrobium alkaliphilum]